jgi:hypothetical protein
MATNNGPESAHRIFNQHFKAVTAPSAR